MSDVNVVVLVGRLTRDAELKYANSGTAICRFSVAVNRRRKNGDQWVDEASYFDVVYWGKGGEAINRFLVKGKQVAIEGELHQNRWEQDGQARSKVEVNANSVQLLGGGQGSSGAGGGDYQPPRGNERPQPQQSSPSRADAPPSPDDFADDIPF
jgi:single-strand DNA-binding protein